MAEAQRLGPFEPYDVWWSAECCRMANNALVAKHSEAYPQFDTFDHPTDEGVSPLAIPITFLSAFTLELYLKCLKTLETGDHLQGHDLAKLVADLRGDD